MDLTFSPYQDSDVTQMSVDDAIIESLESDNLTLQNLSGGKYVQVRGRPSRCSRLGCSCTIQGAGGLYAGLHDWLLPHAATLPACRLIASKWSLITVSPMLAHSCRRATPSFWRPFPRGRSAWARWTWCSMCGAMCNASGRRWSPFLWAPPTFECSCPRTPSASTASMPTLWCVGRQSMVRGGHGWGSAWVSV